MALALVVFALLGATARENPYAGDASLMCQAAESVLASGHFDVDAIRDDTMLGRDGKHYVKYPLLAVLQCVPAVALRDAARTLSPTNAALSGFALGLFPHALAVGVALGAFELALDLGASTAVGVVFALILVFGTPMWPAGRSLYSETLQAMFTLWTVVLARRARDPGARRAALGCGLLAGFAINAKVLLALLPLAVFVDQALEARDGKRVRHIVLIALSMTPGVLAFAGYNWLRYGAPFAQGYGQGRDGALGFNVPLLSGLYALLFSSGKSVFLYAPILLAAVACFASWRRIRARELPLLAIPVVGTLLAVSKWWAWGGDWSWGPRLLLPVVPLACVPALSALQRGGRARAATLALGLAGFAVQLPAVLTAPSRFIIVSSAASHAMLGKEFDSGTVRDDLLPLHFVPEFNPIVGQYWLLGRYLWQSPWTSDSNYPWKSLGVRAWRPGHEPAPKSLDLWVDKRPSSIALEVACVLLTLAAIGWLVRALRPRASP